jgi:hypothetical protein
MLKGEAKANINKMKRILCRNYMSRMPTLEWKKITLTPQVQRLASMEG